MIDAKDDFIMIDVRKGINADQFWISYTNKKVVTLDGLTGLVGEIPSGKKIIVVDLVGKRSHTAVRYLVLKGFSDVSRLSGGIEKWMKDGLPTEYAK